jgi:hypothetical protein
MLTRAPRRLASTWLLIVTTRLGARLTREVRHSENGVADRDVTDAVAQRVDGSGDVQADAAGKRSGQEPSAQLPVRGVQAHGGDPDPDATRGGVGDVDALLSEHVEWFAELVEADGSGGKGAHRVSSISRFSDSH